MRAIVIATLLAACAGPSQQQLAETPTAQTPRTPSLAPPASDDDKERYKVNEQMEQQRDADSAYREAGKESSAPPPPPVSQQPLPPVQPPKKK